MTLSYHVAASCEPSPASLGPRLDYTEAVTVAIARLERLGAFVNGFAEVVRLPTQDTGMSRHSGKTSSL